jgi:uncharacterized protein with PQ loop repeat
VTVAEVVGLAATAVFLCELIPQPLRILRTRSLSGLSPIGTGIYFVTELGWVSYGITSGLVVVLLTALAATVLSGLQLALLWSRRGPNDLWWMLLWATGLAASLVMGAIGAMLVLGLFIGLGPQAWAAWRSSSVSGVSLWRWVLSGTSGMLWCTYGVLMGEFPLMATGSVGMVCASLALSRLVGEQMKRRRVEAHTPRGI